MINKNGAIIWAGPSLIDGSPIALILTGIKYPSHNLKTGDELQTWIIPDNGVSPQDNINNGNDYSVCGNCVHRPYLKPKQHCYVKAWQAAHKVWQCYDRNGYEKLNNKIIENNPRIKFTPLRLGSYGDPAAVPYIGWYRILKHIKKFTGYTHQWDQKFYNPKLSKYCMASVESLKESKKAISKNMRYFRVTDKLDRNKKELICPASKEAGRKLNCINCNACNGTASTRRNVVIVAH